LTRSAVRYDHLRVDCCNPEFITRHIIQPFVDLINQPATSEEAQQVAACALQSLRALAGLYHNTHILLLLLLKLFIVIDHLRVGLPA
jgi:hypothetical protein